MIPSVTAYSERGYLVNVLVEADMALLDKIFEIIMGKMFGNANLYNTFNRINSQSLQIVPKPDKDPQTATMAYAAAILAQADPENLGNICERHLPEVATKGFKINPAELAKYLNRFVALYSPANLEAFYEHHIALKEIQPGSFVLESLPALPEYQNIVEKAVSSIKMAEEHIENLKRLARNLIHEYKLKVGSNPSSDEVVALYQRTVLILAGSVTSINQSLAQAQNAVVALKNLYLAL